MALGLSFFIDIDTKKLKSAVASAEKQFQDFSKKAAGSFDVIFKGAQIAAAAFLAVGAAAVKAALDTSAYVDTMQVAASETGLTTDQLIGLSGAADEAGTSFAKILPGLRQFTGSLGRAQRGSKEAVAAFRDFGVEVEGADTGEALLATIDALKALPTDTERATAAMRVFGTRGSEITAILDGGSAAVVEFISRAADAGALIGTEAANASKLIDQVTTQTDLSLQGLSLTLGGQVAPALGVAGDAFNGALGVAQDLLEKNRATVIAVADAISTSLIAAISLAAGGVARLSEVWNLLTIPVNAVQFAVSAVVATVADLTAQLFRAWEQAVRVTVAINAATGDFLGIGAAAEVMADGIGAVAGAAEAVDDTFTGFADSGAKKAQDAVDSIGDAITLADKLDEALLGRRGGIIDTPDPRGGGGGGGDPEDAIKAQEKAIKELDKIASKAESNRLTAAQAIMGQRDLQIAQLELAAAGQEETFNTEAQLAVAVAEVEIQAIEDVLSARVLAANAAKAEDLARIDAVAMASADNEAIQQAAMMARQEVELLAVDTLAEAQREAFEERLEQQTAIGEAVRKQHEQALQATEDLKKARVDAVESFAGSATTAFGALFEFQQLGGAEASKGLFLASKAAAAGEIAVATAVGLARAAAIPPPGNAAMIAQVLAGTAAASAALAGATISGLEAFDTGGVIGGGGMTGISTPDQVIHRALPGEGVVSRQGMSALGEQGLNAINRGPVGTNARAPVQNSPFEHIGRYTGYEVQGDGPLNRFVRRSSRVSRRRQVGT